MKTTKFNYRGYSFLIEGNVPSGESAVKMMNHINSLNADKGLFKMQVEQYNSATISTINFKKLTK
jgi:hypothetical protein